MVDRIFAQFQVLNTRGLAPPREVKGDFSLRARAVCDDFHVWDNSEESNYHRWLPHTKVGAQRGFLVDGRF
jgi:hypothetical protein